MFEGQHGNSTPAIISPTQQQQINDNYDGIDSNDNNIKTSAAASSSGIMDLDHGRNDDINTIDMKTNADQLPVDEFTAPESAPTVAVRQKDPNRCPVCNIRLKLTDLECDCGLKLCSKHRYSDRHDCTIDYKLKQQELLKKSCPKMSPRNIHDF